MARGRKRKDGPREPNGRISRRRSIAEIERAAIDTGVAARMRLFGLTYEQGRTQEAGSVVGRLYLTGRLGDLSTPASKEQAHERLQAAQTYREVRHAYLRAIGAPGTAVQPPPEVEGMDDEGTAYNRAIRRYGAMMGAVHCDGGHWELMVRALDNIVGRDIDMPFLVPWLVKGLDRIVGNFVVSRPLTSRRLEVISDTLAK